VKMTLLKQNSKPNILCLSHLGWDYVWQRPQHILSRLACHYPVYYVNEPEISCSDSGEPYLKLVANEAHVTAWQPVFPDRKDVLERWREVYVTMVKQLLITHRWAHQNGRGIIANQPLITWFYTPTPYYFLEHIPADVVVYDIMDELANFKHAASDLPEREARLLNQANVVFTGGRTMHQARQGRHPNLHLFPSGVEPHHFAQALDPDTKVAAEIASLPHPILGYYGVIDERLDLDLLHALAAGYPHWSIVIVGPVAKIEPATLPRLPNIHYPGRQLYERLPNFLKGFDVCLMPFAMNEATRSISPTKTLEYMAAHKPIVSTPVPDVVANWSDVVHIAADADQFATAVNTALSESEAQRQQRHAREENHLSHTTWDHIAQQMQAHIEAILSQPAGRRFFPDPRPPASDPRPLIPDPHFQEGVHSGAR
jgi:glycosyltransferase involved in cell wall biosynthesis